MEDLTGNEDNQKLDAEVPAETGSEGAISAHHQPQYEPTPSGRIIRLVAGLLCIGAILIIGILPRLQQSKRLAMAAADKADLHGFVSLVSPEVTSGSSSITLPGNVQAVTVATIDARSSGYLKSIFVDIGSHVRAGQLLAIVESPEVDQQFEQSIAESTRSQANSQQAMAEVSRLQANVAQAQAEVVKSDSNVESSRADLAHAQAKLLEAKGTASEAEARITQAEKRLNGRIAELARMNTRLVLAKITYDRWKELARGGAVSGQDLDESQSNYAQALSSVTSAQADVESAQADLAAARATFAARNGDVAAANADINSYAQKVKAAGASQIAARSNVTATIAGVRAGTASVNASVADIAASKATVNRFKSLRSFEQVVAPFDGVITARNVDVGTLVNAGSGAGTGASDPTQTVPHTGLFGIARTNELRIQVNVPQTYVGLIKVGEQARVDLSQRPGHPLSGTVARTSGALDMSSRTALTEVRILNGNDALVPGMFAQVTFDVHNDKIVVRVPANVLLIDGSGIRVATVRNGIIHFKHVQIGRDFGKTMEITTGLQGSEQLISDPTDNLREGDKVHVTATD